MTHFQKQPTGTAQSYPSPCRLGFSGKTKPLFSVCLQAAPPEGPPPFFFWAGAAVESVLTAPEVEPKALIALI